MIKIAIDCMGGDVGLPVTIPASITFAKRYKDTSLLLVGLESEIKFFLNKINNVPFDRINIVPADEVVTMSDSIEVALRKKKKSSMHIAVQSVKNGFADACISSGNTAAWMAISKYFLKTLEGIERPAISTSIPNQNGNATTILDLGANVDCSANNLLQFAVMGTALVQSIDFNNNPSVGLLNIGEELIKGNIIVKSAFDLLSSSNLNFYGNVEGDDIFKGTVDIVVCDGFVGNIVLKSVEGLAKMFSMTLKEEFKKDLLSSFVGVLAMPVIHSLRNRLDNRRYNGASLLGLNGIVFKSHGSADIVSFDFALSRARDAVINNLLDRISIKVHEINRELRIKN
ncbi:glycerol-3-phosphate acyltransferase PlsX [Candidatus Kinetoplastibacterium desouzaii TCC079E]|uniref:Phosphate acyltransferase n=1 Tax=Candidatus Kinetoplastidibacterium desouzai TCC079E TaxID=1208919 RepID=M1LUM5_9PROT|nr:phosphate acyltransferase PlsX [Candidatus Kinetoplastibacterium desouzaii]AGF47014.1 glycerol-3-phosphate acyltransferase PlsX [Candidatus Kinetoplastibacterium desouzaii TCC079E]